MNRIVTSMLLVAVSAMSQAGGLPVGMRANGPAAAWTDADMERARPLTPRSTYLPSAVFDYNAAVAEAQSGTASVSVAGSRGGADASHLFRQRTLRKPAAADADTGPALMSAGTGSLQFTSTRTFPNASDTTYPTRTVGKLYFRDPAQPGSTFVCSGSMIKPGVVLTAGHCVHDGRTHFFTDFVFVPGFRNGAAPYGEWTNWVDVRTTTAWSTGGGAPVNTGDWATIVFGADATGKRIGDYTGTLGYQTSLCSGRHQSVLGYPANLDSGAQMHRVDGQATSYGSLNNCTWGSDMEGGSSGGPVVLNFQKAYANSSSAPSENQSNRVVATVSWGYVGTSKVQGGSILNNNFVTLINNTCSANPGAC